MAGGTGVSLRADQSVTFHRRRSSQRTGKLPVRSYHDRRLGSRISMIIRSRRRRDLIPQDVARIHSRPPPFPDVVVGIPMSADRVLRVPKYDAAVLSESGEIAGGGEIVSLDAR